MQHESVAISRVNRIATPPMQFDTRKMKNTADDKICCGRFTTGIGMIYSFNQALNERKNEGGKNYCDWLLSETMQSSAQQPKADKGLIFLMYHS